jgi:formate dehydrogenase maturation protein FdhE
MGHAKTFADKMAKSTVDYSKHCPVCGESLRPVLYVVSEKSKTTGAWRFNQRFVGVCKCNEHDIMD